MLTEVSDLVGRIHIYNNSRIRMIGENFKLNMRAFVAILLLTAVADGKDSDTNCPPEQENDWTIEKLLRHEDCEKFYKCTFGKPVVMLCPASLWFNLDTWQCDYPHNVDCSGRNEPTVAPSNGTTWPSKDTTPVSTSPASIPTTTTNLTTITTITTSTPSSTTTTSTTPRPTTSSTNSSTTETTTTEIEFTKNGCPVNPHVHWLLPHETNCNLFFYCVWGEKVLRQCPSSLHFNKVKKVCDFSYRAGCSTSFDKNARRRREILSEFKS